MLALEDRKIAQPDVGFSAENVGDLRLIRRGKPMPDGANSGLSHIYRNHLGRRKVEYVGANRRLVAHPILLKRRSVDQHEVENLAGHTLVARFHFVGVDALGANDEVDNIGVPKLADHLRRQAGPILRFIDGHYARPSFLGVFREDRRGTTRSNLEDRHRLVLIEKAPQVHYLIALFRSLHWRSGLRRKDFVSKNEVLGIYPLILRDAAICSCRIGDAELVPKLMQNSLHRDRFSPYVLVLERGKSL